MRTINRITKDKKTFIVFITCFFAVFIINVFKIYTNSTSSDEDFYIVEGLRMYRGDMLIVDDWHIAQLIGLFICPFIKIYCLFNNNLDGIVLFMRYVYVFIIMIVGVAIYLKFSRYKYWAVFASCIYILFSPYNIMALSYNSLSSIFLVLCLCAYDSNKMFQKWRMILSGVFFALSVMNIPYLAVLFFFLSIYCLLIKKELRKKFIWFSIGVICMFVSFCIYFLISVDVKQIVKVLPYLLDDAHDKLFIVNVINSVGRLVVEFHLFVLLFVVISYLSIKNKIDRKSAYIYSIVATAFSIIYILSKGFQKPLGGYSLVLFPLSWFSIETYILTDKSKRSSRNIIFSIVSIIYGILTVCGSNVGTRALCNCLIISVITLPLNIFDYSKEKSTKSAMIVVICTICLLGYFRINFNFGATDKEARNVRIDKGPYMYLYSSKQEVEDYYELYDDMNKIREIYSNGCYCFLTNGSWEYLEFPRNFITDRAYNYSLNNVNLMIQNKEKYFSMQNKKPIYFYIEKGNLYNLSCNDQIFDNANYIDDFNKGCLLKID